MRLYKRIELWGESPGSRVNVNVLWPRYLWVKEPVQVDGREYPNDFATLSEQIKEYYRQYPELKPKHCWS